MIVWFLLVLAMAAPADIRRCLAANDVPCAEREIAQLDVLDSSQPDLLALAANTSFYGGHYDEATERMRRAVAAGYHDRWEELGLYERTAEVMKDWAEVRTKRFVIRYRPGLDSIILEDAQTTLEHAEDYITPLLGGPPPGPIILEIYPDGRSFIAASSLTAQDVRTTGVVALSKWSRLLLTSPRALGRGYSWKDTVAHEYIHLVVAHRTDDQAPVWLQEGIARYLDNRWTDGRNHFRLGPRDEGLIAKALQEADEDRPVDLGPDENWGLVPFERMHPSLAKLPSAEMAALAYAQLASLMDYSFEKGGENILTQVLPEVRRGVDPGLALAQGVGASSFEALQQDWMVWLKTKRLQMRQLDELPTVLDGGDVAESDPVMAEREDLRRWMRLGDLLREHGRPKAALIEYAQAIDPSEPTSPLLANRMAQAHVQLGDLAAARAALEGSEKDYPEFALTHKTLGEILNAEGNTRGAYESFQRALDLNPFDPEVLKELEKLAGALNDKTALTRYERYQRILRRGGLEDHEVHRLIDGGDKEF